MPKTIPAKPRSAKSKKLSLAKFSQSSLLKKLSLFGIVVLLVQTFNLAAPLPAQASGVVGSGPGTCNEAAFVSALAGGGLITFNCGSAPVTISLSSARVIDTAVTLDGAGGSVTLSGRGQNRIFYINSNTSLTLKNLTLADGFSNDRGGAIYGGGMSTLNIANCQFHSNVVRVGLNADELVNLSQGGGAIYMDAKSSLTIDKSEFRDNLADLSSGGAIHTEITDATITDSQILNNRSTAPGRGGGFYVNGVNVDSAQGGAFKLQTSIVNGNFAEGQGGGIYAYLFQDDRFDTMIIDRSTISNNTVTTYAGDSLGGGLRFGNGKLFVTGSTFVGNSVQSQGGGIWLGEVAYIGIVNTTIASNRSVSADGTGGLGGGVAIGLEDRITFFNTTIAANRAGLIAGGIHGGSRYGSMVNTIVANNVADNGGQPWNTKQNCIEELANSGNNMQYPPLNQYDPEDSGCATNITFADPKLGPLADNGGPTLTMALLPGSPAINAANQTQCAADPVNSKDQRGLPRPVGACDIGAYEVEPPPTISKSFTPTTIGANSSSRLKFVLTNPNAFALSGVTFVDNMPASITVAAIPNLVNDCSVPGQVSASSGSGSINVSGLGLAANQVCSITVSVGGTIGGTFNNTTGPIKAKETNAGAPSNTASLIILLPPTVQKSFGPNTILIGGSSTLTFVLANPNASVALSGITFSDPLPGGLSVAANPGLVNQCNPGSSVSAAASTISVAGVQLAANQSCTIKVNVTGPNLPARLTNVTAPISATETGPGFASNAAVLKVVAPVYTSAPAQPGGTFNLGATKVGVTKSASFVVKNGGDPLTTLSVSLSGGTLATALTGPNSAEFSISASASFPFSLPSGNSQTITVSCTPTALSKRSATLTLLTNDPLQPTVTHNLTCAGAYVVSSNSDDGHGGIANSFSQVLSNSFSQGQGIVFELPSGGTILFNGPLTVPVPSGVTIDGGCGSNGKPLITLDGGGLNSQGLRLSGNTTLIGLQVQKFRNPQISTGGIGNHLYCVIANGK